VLFSLALSVTAGWAGELRLGRYFTDNLVLQREKPVVIRGVAEKGATVTVVFAGQEKAGKTDADGAWSVTLDPLKASATPQTLKAVASVGNQQSSIGNVLVGDVFLFARQTSIDVSVGRDEEGRKAAAAHKRNPLLRAIGIRTIPAAKPQGDLAGEATGGWAEVSRESALAMSAAAYYLGRDLSAQAGVPVGIVDLNMGSAFPISWLSRETLEETEKFYGKSDVPGQLKRFDEAMELAGKGEAKAKDNLPTNVTAYALFPAGGHNAVLNPLRGLALKAALIQLGNDYPYMIYAALERDGKPFDRAELNDAYVRTYDIRKNGFRMEPVTTPRIPREWRGVFGDRELPIGLVVPPGSALNTSGQHNREMRELQRLIARDNPSVGVILPGSENIPFSAEPRDEALLAGRCLSWVRGAVYREPGVPATGPLFDRLDLSFNEATVRFAEGTARGLRATTPGALDQFEVAGVEGEYVPVQARTDGETVRIASDKIGRITRVRYNWNSMPDQGLVNAAGLPALPFRSEKAEYHWFVTNQDSDLPIEYYTPANEWKKNDVTLVNGQLKTHGYNNFSGWLGPIGVMTGPFGPNMGVREVKLGSPAYGKLFEGDVIYSANGRRLGEKAWEVMADAITESETEGKGGKLLLGVRRDGKNMDVEVTLKVMGTYSSTAPYDCPKTERIVKDLEKWVVENGADAGFLNTDALFMLATGNPELQGHVRRIVYKIMEGRNPTSPIDPTKAGKSWINSAEAILLGEYYLATGDRNVLPHLKHACDRLAATQNQQEGGWRHNFPGGATYGLIPNAGLPGVMGMYFARTAGLDIDMASYKLGVDHFRDRRAETGFLIYGFGGCQRPVPLPFDPDDFQAGRLNSYNGGLSAAGILMRFTENYRAAHLCSLISAYAWNNTFGGHGGNFWNNFWTPLGAHDHGRKAFINFWRNYRWYRELNRMFDGSIIQHEDGKSAAGCGVALVAPRERIQITGAAPSPFAADAPSVLKPALDAYWNKDYAGCRKLVQDLTASGTVGTKELPTVEYLVRQADEIQTSIGADLARMEELCKAGDPAQAKTLVAELKGILPDGDERLAGIEKMIAATRQSATAGTGAKNASARKPAEDVEDADDAAKKAEAAVAAAEKAAAAAAPPRTWECLVTEIATEKSKDGPGKVPPEEASTWRMKVVEAPSQAPEGWMKPGFDDAAWGQTHLPISWRMYHTALLRTTFTVKDQALYDGLRFRGWLFRQQGIEIYLNGKLIGKVNNLEEKTGNVDAEFNESALKHLKTGENTLALTTRHNWRWGMLFMNVYNDGFGFRLDARRKGERKE
jgi:sialate O-acetylesterase